MTAYLLDTNIYVYLINGKYELAARLKRAKLPDCYLSELTVAELLYGVTNSAPTHQLANRQRLDDFLSLFDEQILPISEFFGILRAAESAFKTPGPPARRVRYVNW